MEAVERRDYAGAADLLLMQTAVRRTWTPRSGWHIGDLAWQRTAIPGQQSTWRTSLWIQDRQVVAWGWAELPGHLEWYVDPGRARLASAVLDWFDGVATGDERSLTAMETDAHLIAAAEQAGFRAAADTPFFEHCHLELGEALPRPDLPDGYRVRAVREDEADARAAVHRAAWRPGRIGELLVPPVDLGTGESSVTAASYAEVMKSWPYRHDLDQVVEAADGTLVAFALGWLDDVNRAGELEPVGTDPEHGRRGLGAAASLACLHALRAAGATRAVVYPRGDPAYPVARRLYDGLGFRPVA
ncbi:MAG: GNAT family N-acetyltransferase, partial [Nocardioidaceae bacterium]